ncbi:DUF2971 domain-containing protein [Marinagarivorans cellulosilyticus]|uniref:DUF2971 domain-containing protein n=1 Tax=Marinagarivorans cellulosilyticus TaxID=2721545 RepID=A0AAN1WL88_9GAMM|nr:DUF2971 domain-containing protein [Marinagarivorans cellulosilyticus]BCD99639.1 hypothetical protein MARGE09_P3841 [Marinagarivorans cellulosilyticus]
MIEYIGGLKSETKIQRYMDLGKFMDILENQQLFFCNINCFEDKLEGASTPLNEFFSSGAASALSNFANNTLVSSFGKNLNPPEEIEAAKKRSEEYVKESENRSVKTVFGEVKLDDNLTYRDVVKAQKSWLDVSCWHVPESSQDNMAMWKIYGQSSQSICITTTLGKILDALNLPLDKAVAAVKVNYIDHENHYFQTSHCLNPFIHKHLAYKYENEARIIVYPRKQNPLERRATSAYGTPIKLVGTEFIEEVRVCPEAPEWFCSLILSLKGRYGLRAEMGRSNLDLIAQSYGI